MFSLLHYVFCLFVAWFILVRSRLVLAASLGPSVHPFMILYIFFVQHTISITVALAVLWLSVVK